MPGISKGNKKAVKTYIFKATYINEYDAFSKYYDAIRENGYITRIFNELEDLGDYCDLHELPNTDQYEDINLYYEPLPIIARSSSIIYAFGLVELQNNNQKGRHLVAKKGISRGEIIINEHPTVLQVEPVCVCVGNTNSLYRCHNCGIACKLFYTCGGCNVCIFCSRNCLRVAYKNYHRYECYGLQRHFWSMEDTDYSYLAFRMMLYGASKEFNTDIEDSSYYGSSANNYPFIYKLETNFMQMSCAKINKMLYSAVKNLIYLIKKTSFFNQFKGSCDLEDIQKYVGGLMVKHYCQAQMNNVILKYPNYKLEFGFNVVSGSGKAICPTIALLNHSCSPNAVVIVFSEYVVVKCLKPIKAGEEITICYSEVSALMTVNERQLITREILGFTCQCSFCEFEKTSNEAPYKCSLCVNGNAKLVDKIDERYIGYCFGCDDTFSMEDVCENLKTIAVCKKVYKSTFSIEHVERMAKCYENIFPAKSLHLVDVYKLLYEKHVHGGEKPLEVARYGILLFSMVEQVLPKLYLPVLIAKLKFVARFVEMEKCSELGKVTPEEL
ncbi:hypothetical protein JTB14_001740 [Gonioctena quinquepunctata]|nr:hypothetical protein JTB14_001740 [Gonioctena quinquepunctata]